MAGVCAGLADHLGVDVLLVRFAFVLLTMTKGAGLVIYGALWVFAPQAEPGTRSGPGSRRYGGTGGLVSTAALVLGALLLAATLGLGTGTFSLWPLALIAGGVVLVWRQADESSRARWRRAAGAQRVAGWLRLMLGGVLVLVGGLWYVLSRSQLDTAWQTLLAGAVVAAGLALLSGPWWLRMARDLSAERSARIREQERAEVAAHVHDSVLHTLTLIQRHVDDPREVARLARAQERDLRTWLYRGSADPSSTVKAALERVAAEVEDAHGVPVDVVVVGDGDLDERLTALLQASREALVNAAKYAGPGAISVYAEVEPDQVTVFVRDHGPGFDLAAVPADRMGVRGSIIGRMERHGGRAHLRGGPDGGTEVQLEMPREMRVSGS